MQGNDISQARNLDEREAKLLRLASRLLGVAVQTVQAGVSRNFSDRLDDAYDSEKLYPKLTITSAHGGGSIFMDLVLCNPVTDQIVAQLLRVEGTSEGGTPC